jgi:uncharacterized protein (TIGR02466 family)
VNRIDLFSTPIAIFQPDKHKEISESIMANLHHISNWPKPFTRGEHNDMFTVCPLPFFIELKEIMLKHCAEYANSVFAEDEYTPDHFEVSRSWMQILNPQEPFFPGVHNHKLTSIACVFYVNVKENSGTITFVDPRSTLGWVSLDQSKSMNKYRLQPRSGNLLMFPGWLLHEVGLNNSNEKRVIVGANLMLKHEYIKNYGY